MGPGIVKFWDGGIHLGFGFYGLRTMKLFPYYGGGWETGWAGIASRISARGKRTYQGVSALNLGAICKPLLMVDAAS